MRYLSVTEIAKKWNVSDRSVRNYCAKGRVNGAFLTGKTWNIPENAEKPERSNKKKEQPITLLDIQQEQKKSRYSGGIYHKTQIDLTYNSNHIEGSRLTHEQTRYIFETNTIGVVKDVLNVDDVIETTNHFRCIDIIIDNAKAVLTEKFIKKLHLTLKNGTSDSRKDWFSVGDYKKMPNEVSGMDTALPEEVANKMKELLAEYNGKEEKTFEYILDFHVKFERIHPFQDGNGRMSRLLTTLLLYRCGYVVGRYISLESKIEKTKENYYDVLERCGNGWHENENEPAPFIKYMLGIVLAAYRDFETRISLVDDKLPAIEMVRKAVCEKIGKFTKSEIMELVPSLSKASVENSLTQLMKDGVVDRHGKGKATFYTRADV